MVCAGETNACLDDYIAVALMISPRVRAIAFHDLGSLTAEKYYFRYKFSAETYFYGGVIPEGVHDVRTAEYFRRSIKILDRLGPGEQRWFELGIEPDFFAVDESVYGSQGFFMVAGVPASSDRSMDLSVRSATRSWLSSGSPWMR